MNNFKPYRCRIQFVMNGIQRLQLVALTAKGFYVEDDVSDHKVIEKKALAGRTERKLFIEESLNDMTHSQPFGSKYTFSG